MEASQPGFCRLTPQNIPLSRILSSCERLPEGSFDAVVPVSESVLAGRRVRDGLPIFLLPPDSSHTIAPATARISSRTITLVIRAPCVWNGYCMPGSQVAVHDHMSEIRLTRYTIGKADVYGISPVV